MSSRSGRRSSRNRARRSTDRAAIAVWIGAALFAALTWALIDIKALDLTGATAPTCVVLPIFGAIPGVGLSWSVFRARATGEVEVQ